jgi:hypothetical protein
MGKTAEEKTEAAEAAKKVEQESLPELITTDDKYLFTFSEYRKKGTTQLSDQTVPKGQKVDTPEGEYTCWEDSRIAIDADGKVYPVAVSVFEKSYEAA